MRAPAKSEEDPAGRAEAYAVGEEGKGEMGPSDRKQGASDCKASGRSGW